MKTKSLVLAAALFALPLFCVVEAHAKIQRVLVVQVENVDSYLAELRRGQALLDEMGSVQKLRVWRARFGGPGPSTLTITIEYPDLAAYAEDEKKTAAHAKFQSWFKQLAPQRKVISDSLYDERPL